MKPSLGLASGGFSFHQLLKNVGETQQFCPSVKFVSCVMLSTYHLELTSACYIQFYLNVKFLKNSGLCFVGISIYIKTIILIQKLLSVKNQIWSCVSFFTYIYLYKYIIQIVTVYLLYTRQILDTVGDIRIKYIQNRSPCKYRGGRTLHLPS